MQLLGAHVILIAAAMSLTVVFALHSVVMFSRGGGTRELVLGLASLAVGGLLGVYFRSVRARWLAAKAGRRPGR